MTVETQTAARANAPLAPGFTNPVHDASRCFRALMQAMARPGAPQPFDTGALVPPAPLSAALAAAALTLLDYDTPVWLDPILEDQRPVADYLRFHTGAPIISNQDEAAFALIADPTRLTGLGNFNQGTLDYPDRSTTLLLQCESFETGPAVNLEGPGIKTREIFRAHPLPPYFWDQLIANNAQFPRGVDVILVGPESFTALPRSLVITKTEA